MTLQEFRAFFNTELTPIYPKTEIDSFFFLMIKDLLNFEIFEVFSKPNFVISPEKEERAKNILAQLKKEQPIQYILGKTEFYNLPFKVEKEVLIPRPETEELVQWVLDDTVNLNTSKKSVLDIGTGSGCIAVTIKKKAPNAIVFALDVSKKALSIAKENAKLNNVEIHFIEQDILKTEKLSQQFNVIISNPPYVRVSEKKEMQNNVLQYEPHLALFVSNENPLIFYNKIADIAQKQLTKKGVLYLEINQYLAKQTQELMLKKGFKEVILKKDLFGNFRMLKVINNA